MLNLETFKPGSKIDPGLYLVRKPYTEDLCLMEFTDGVITNMEKMSSPYNWSTYPEKWRGYILYGPISKPEVEKLKVTVDDLYCHKTCDFLEKVKTDRWSQWKCHKYTDSIFLEDGVDFDKYYRPKRCESCLKIIPRKPVIVKNYILKTEPFEAIQWTYENFEDVKKFIGDSFRHVKELKELVFVGEDGKDVVIDLGDYVVADSLCFKVIRRREFESKFIEW